MRAFTVILAFVSAALANPVLFADSQQIPLGNQQQRYPGFDVDLNERRLIQLEGQQPVWLTELDKVLYFYNYLLLYRNLICISR